MATLDKQQLQIMAADIAKNPDMNTQKDSADGDLAIAALYNQPAAPDFFVWKTSVAVGLLMQGNFDWTRVEALTVGKARIWEFMTAAQTVNPSQKQVRAGFEETFTEVEDAPCRQAIYDGASRLATRGEKLYAVGTGAAPDNHGSGPGELVVEGIITTTNVSNARDLLPKTAVTEIP